MPRVVHMRDGRIEQDERRPRAAEDAERAPDTEPI
jgi:hypothetical protein